jgi:hypothetical protein
MADQREPQGRADPGAGAQGRGFTRLYRAEPIPGGKEWAEWVEVTRDELGITQAEGRWFVADPALLDWYREDAVGPTHTVYVDVPTAELERYRVANSEERIGLRPVRSFSRDPENEFFLPRDLAEAKRVLPAGRDTAPDKAGSSRSTTMADSRDDRAVAELEARIGDFKQLGAPDGGGARRPWGELSERRKLHEIAFEIDELHLGADPRAHAILAREVDLDRVPEEERRMLKAAAERREQRYMVAHLDGTVTEGELTPSLAIEYLAREAERGDGRPMAALASAGTRRGGSGEDGVHPKRAEQRTPSPGEIAGDQGRPDPPGPERGKSRCR